MRILHAESIIVVVLSLGAATLAMTGCDTVEKAKGAFEGESARSKAQSEASRPRVNVVSGAGTTSIPQGWCEKRYENGQGPVVVLPQTDVLNEGPAVRTGRPGWINMWATWCRPCIAEIPHILRWRDARLGNGTIFSLQMLSVDEDLNEFKSFMSRHTELRTTMVMRMSDPTGLGAYASSLGLGSDTTVPIHVFAGSDNRIVCVRAGGITESDLGVIRELMR